MLKTPYSESKLHIKIQAKRENLSNRIVNDIERWCRGVRRG